MPAGRPTKLDQVVRTRDDGTNVTAGEQVIDRVQLGMPLAAAADSAGLDRVTLHRWRVEGARLRAEHAQGRLRRPNRKQSNLIAFCNGLERAEAEAEASRLAIVQRAAVGGGVTTKTTVKTDASGNVVERTTVTETLAPQWTAAAWWLERRRGYVKRYEVTGADGQPLVPPDEAARGLADSLRDFLTGAATAQALSGPQQAIETTATDG